MEQKSGDMMDVSGSFSDEFKEGVVELYLDEQIGFDPLKEFIGKLDAESVRASKAILDQGDDLANELVEL